MSSIFRVISFILLSVYVSISIAETFNMNDLDGVNGYAMNSSNVGDNIGLGQVHGIGDFDGDGIDDFVVGTSTAPLYEKDYVGRAYLVYGTEENNFVGIDLNVLESGDGSLGFLINGVALGDGVGMTVGQAGDFNNDGFSDLIIGGQVFSFGINQAFVVYGFSGRGVSKFELSSLASGTGKQGFRLQETSSGSSSVRGLQVSAAGDFNGDGISDLMVGSPSANGLADGNPQDGRVYVLYGSEGASYSNVELESLISGDASMGVAIIGETGGGHAGEYIDSAGDINNDGLDDLIFSSTGAANNAGKVYVVLGGYSQAVLKLDELTTTTGMVLVGEFEREGTVVGDAIGSVAGIGDFNGDGFDDIAIGAKLTRNQTTTVRAGPGRVYVVYGGPNSERTDMNVGELRIGDGEFGFEINQEEDIAFLSLGRIVSSAGDFNGDGFDDLMIGETIRRGSILLIYGGVTNDPVVKATEISDGKGIRFFGENDIFDSTGDFGNQFASAGDVNNDGVSDILITAKGTEKVYTLFGSELNTKPEISAIANLDISANTTSDPIVFTISDSQSAVEELTLEIQSSDETVMPVSGVVLSGAASERTLTLTPATNTVGFVDVSIRVTDPQGEESISGFSVNVIDTTPPVLTLSGVNPQTITVGNAYIESGANAEDAIDGDLTSAITVDSSSLDTATIGTYTVVYSVIDAAENLTQENRTVQVNAAAPTPAPAPSTGGGGALGIFELLFFILLTSLTRVKFARRSSILS